MATKKKTKSGRAKPKMPAGFKKGEIVRVSRKHGKLPTGEAEVMGGCFGREDYVSVKFDGAGGKGRPRLGCVPVASVSGFDAKKKTAAKRKAVPRKTKAKRVRRPAQPFGDVDIIMAPTEIAGIAENPWFTDGSYKKRGKKIYPKGKKR
jgi:hypothetical protein